MPYLVEILVTYKKHIRNPEAGVIQACIRNVLNYDIENMDKGKYFSYVSKQKNEEDTKKEAEELSDKLLANINMETFKILSIKNLDVQSARGV